MGSDAIISEGTVMCDSTSSKDQIRQALFVDCYEKLKETSSLVATFLDLHRGTCHPAIQSNVKEGPGLDP